MPAAARLSDPIAHANPTLGLMAGKAAGLEAGALAGAAVLASAGASGIAVSGLIVSGSPNVFINSLPVARANLDTAVCNGHGPVLVVQGSASVYVNGQPVWRVGDAVARSAIITSGSSNVFIGGATKVASGAELTQALLAARFPATWAWAEKQIGPDLSRDEVINSIAKLYGVRGGRGVAYTAAGMRSIATQTGHIRHPSNLKQ